MVSIRPSHQLATQNIDHWLSELQLIDEKKVILKKHWQQLQSTFNEQPACLSKSFEMVEILASLNMDADALAAAFICPLYENDIISLDYINEHFSQKVYLLCHGVSQMQAINVLHYAKSNTVNANQIDNIRRMLLAMVEDVRAVVIKLAERLCNLYLVKNDDEETRVLAAKEVKLIYAPLANRLGIGQLKWEMEDISFRYLHPTTYKNIAKELDEKRLDRERYMVDFVNHVSGLLADMNINAQVYGRPKHIYSIWKKMQQKSLDFEQLFDVRAVRVIVDELQSCYGVLGAIHTNWKHLPSEFDDYIATPKSNGYQSIHTVILGPEGKTIEIQIRTQQMHDDAELGVAAHWRYKEGSASGKTSGFDEKISWLRKILQWQEDVSETGQLVEELRSQVFEDRIYVFTPNGDVIDLPNGATPLDFAYYIHSNVGHSCIGAKVFGRIVPFTHKLQTGDQVEILRSKKLNPSRDWLNPNLNYIHTPRARSKVQHFFRLLDRDKNIVTGKELLDAALVKVQISPDKVILTSATEKFNFVAIDDLYAAIGAGNVRLQQVINFLQQRHEPDQDDFDPQELLQQSSVADPQSLDSHTADNNGITVSGVGNLMTHFAKCCQPVKGDDIVGFITQGRGISVHRVDCRQLEQVLKRYPEREVDVQWGDRSKQNYQVSIKVIGSDRQGLLRDIFTIVSNEGISIVGLDSHSDSAKQTVIIHMKVEIANNQVLTRLMNKINQLDDIININRM